MPVLKSAELLAIRTAGAYGAVMASTYNTRPLAPEVLVKDDAYAVIRPRQVIDDILAQERLPEWLAD
jgi:diaminopimelate decarboxylase